MPNGRGDGSSSRRAARSLSLLPSASAHFRCYSTPCKLLYFHINLLCDFCTSLSPPCPVSESVIAHFASRRSSLHRLSIPMALIKPVEVPLEGRLPQLVAFDLDFVGRPCWTRDSAPAADSVSSCADIVGSLGGCEYSQWTPWMIADPQPLSVDTRRKLPLFRARR